MGLCPLSAASSMTVTPGIVRITSAGYRRYLVELNGEYFRIYDIDRDNRLHYRTEAEQKCIENHIL